MTNKIIEYKGKINAIIEEYSSGVKSLSKSIKDEIIRDHFEKYDVNFIYFDFNKAHIRIKSYGEENDTWYFHDVVSLEMGDAKWGSLYVNYDNRKYFEYGEDRDVTYISWNDIDNADDIIGIYDYLTTLDKKDLYMNAIKNDSEEIFLDWFQEMKGKWNCTIDLYKKYELKEIPKTKEFQSVYLNKYPHMFSEVQKKFGIAENLLVENPELKSYVRRDKFNMFRTISS